MYPLKQHNAPVTHSAGHSSYIRLAFLLDRYPSSEDLQDYDNCVRRWSESCAERYGAELRALEAIVYYRRPEYRVQFDIVDMDYPVIDELIDAMCSVSGLVGGVLPVVESGIDRRRARIAKITVGYYNLP